MKDKDTLLLEDIYDKIGSDESSTDCKSAEEITNAFKKDLKALLSKYNATLDVETAPGSWRNSSIETLTLTIPAEYDSNNDCTAEFVNVDLGRYFTQDEV
jgi:hypothetical protein